MDFRMVIRTKPGPHHFNDRKLSVRFDVDFDEKMSLYPQWLNKSWV